MGKKGRDSFHQTGSRNDGASSYAFDAEFGKRKARKTIRNIDPCRGSLHLFRPDCKEIGVDKVKGDDVIKVLMGIIAVALVTTVVMRPNSATVIKAAGSAFSGSLRAAMGK